MKPSHIAVVSPAGICGEGRVVEIDETSMYNHGTRHDEYWLFGGVDRTTKQWFGVVTFGDLTKPTLLALIKKGHSIWDPHHLRQFRIVRFNQRAAHIG
ncbi:hypothetical protein H257_08860 [Aphanomyces astaci]|uniref:ISXO2-like transposase domain-containing protein n=1 Tax=Aphanomyces astaci TaxID=112090 RepID=W4GEP9_APHAT|nr:hypothetical protein H257_08860 [Aphanomyces astaci]ETV77443.1 hypothetical protein H257_08860 [Aphanomyces astaci]|eukprot:XP_009833230.1 hypothetical protein H257_08860 [Aphanomyces astaci]